MENSEKKLPVRNLERIAEKTFVTYIDARHAKDGTASQLNCVDVEKVKIFARHTNTYDVVWYKKIGEQVNEVKPEQKPAEPKVHGLTAKERRAQEKRKNQGGALANSRLDRFEEKKQ